eukprot:UN27508
MSHYHGKTCDDDLNVFDDTDTWENKTYEKIRDLCGLTCFFRDYDVPWEFGDDYRCATHEDCNSAGMNDYFCATCDSSDACAFGSETCGICGLTKESDSAQVCVEFENCSLERAVDGECDAWVDTDVCDGAQVFHLSTIPACYEMFQVYAGTSDNHTSVCDCYLDDAFCTNSRAPTPAGTQEPVTTPTNSPTNNPFVCGRNTAYDCLWTREHLYTLNENAEFCDVARPEDCGNISDPISCASAVANNHFGEADHHTEFSTGCVWLDRLVKGKCVADPCLSEEQDCEDCQMCQSNETGQWACVFDPSMAGNACTDEDPETG